MLDNLYPALILRSFIVGFVCMDHLVNLRKSNLSQKYKKNSEWSNNFKLNITSFVRLYL